MIMYYLRDAIATFGAVAFFCVIMSLPKKAIALSSLCGSLTYVIYRVIYLEFGHEMVGYLLATLFAAASAEILARKCKMPTTIFVFPGIIPLVPGVGLHRSMLCLVNNDLSGFINEGVKTLFISGIIAVTVAVVNASVRSLFAKNNSGKSRFTSINSK